MMTTTMMAKERFQILGNNQRTSKSFFRQTSSYFLAGSKEGRNSWLRNVKCFKSIHLHQGVQPNKKLILWHQKKGKSGFNSEFEFQKLFANSKLTIITQVGTYIYISTVLSMHQNELLGFVSHHDLESNVKRKMVEEWVFSWQFLCFRGI